MAASAVARRPAGQVASAGAVAAAADDGLGTADTRGRTSSRPATATKATIARTRPWPRRPRGSAPMAGTRPMASAYPLILAPPQRGAPASAPLAYLSFVDRPAFSPGAVRLAARRGTPHPGAPGRGCVAVRPGCARSSPLRRRTACYSMMKGPSREIMAQVDHVLLVRSPQGSAAHAAYGPVKRSTIPASESRRQGLPGLRFRGGTTIAENRSLWQGPGRTAPQLPVFH